MSKLVEYGSNPVRNTNENVRTFTSSVRSVYEVHRLQTQTGAYWGPIDKYLLHCIRTLRTGFEPYSNSIKYNIKEDILLNGFEYVEISRIRVEPSSNPVRNTNVYEVHEVHRSYNTFTTPSNLYEPFTRFNHPFVYEIFSSNAN